MVYQNHLRIPKYVLSCLDEISNSPDSDREYIKEVFDYVFPKHKLLAKGLSGQRKNEIQRDVFSSVEYFILNGNMKYMYKTYLSERWNSLNYIYIYIYLFTELYRNRVINSGLGDFEKRFKLFDAVNKKKMDNFWKNNNKLFIKATANRQAKAEWTRCIYPSYF